jgi:ABC-type multidrug transport system fused ATPase/permease subunit
MSKEEKEDMQTPALRNDIRKSNVRTAIPTTNRKPRPPRPAGDACPCAIIRSEDFSLYYGSKVGVKNITMDIYPCSVTAIIGPSGCGKSTFLRSINRMNDLIPHVHHEGRLEVAGQDVYDKRTSLVNLRQEVGMVFQKPNPFPKSIFDNVAWPSLQGPQPRELQNAWSRVCGRRPVKKSRMTQEIALFRRPAAGLCIASPRRQAGPIDG